MKVMIWGTGDWAERFIATLGIPDEKIQGFIESKKGKETYRGKRVYGAEEIGTLDFDVVIVVSSHANEIADEIERQGIEKSKVIFPDREKIGMLEDVTGKGADEYDWLRTQNCRMWIVFSYGIYTNSKKKSERCKTVLSLAEFWKKQDAYHTITGTVEAQRLMLEKYFIPEISKEDIVCDFACASGEWSEFIARGAGKVEGFDCSEKMLETAKKNAALKKINNVSYNHMDAENVKFDRQYDHFLMLGLLTCIEDDTTADMIVSTVAKSIKPGGYLAVRDTLSMFETDKIYYNERNYSVVFRTQDTYVNLYIKNGFELVAEEYLNVYAHQPIEYGSHGYIFRKKYKEIE